MIAPTLLNNRYKVLGVLASGGFGETFLAEDTQMPSGRRCVIKQLKPIANNSQVYQLMQQRFQREAAILEDLGDGNHQIPTLYAYFTHEDQFYLVQDYIEGQTLTNKLEQEGLQSESSVKEILINILPTLNYVHSKHIVHRDIKPDNIIIRSSDRLPILIDFGAVKETVGTVITPSGNTARSIVIGTPGFMPMEQSVGRPVFSSDIYSLGLTAIYLLTGKIPQEFSTDPGTGNLLWRNYALSISPSFANILDKAIEQSPHGRYQTAMQMLSALQSPDGMSSSGEPSPFADTTPPPGYQPVAPTVPVTPQVSAQTPHQTPPQVNQPQSASVSHTATNSQGLGTWQQAVIIGGVIGAVMVGGLFGIQRIISRSNSSDSNQIAQVDSVTESQTGSLGNSNPGRNIPNTSLGQNNQSVNEGQNQNRIPDNSTNNQTENSNSNPPPQVNNSAAISRGDAEKVVQNWMKAKREIFAPPYNKALGRQLLTGKALRDNISKVANPDACIDKGTKQDECLSSVEWLSRNNAYYSYGVQRLDNVKKFAASGNRATIEVVITEERSLFKDGKQDRTNTAFDTSSVRYSLVLENGTIKISDYKTL